MKAINTISTEIPYIKPSDSPDKVIGWMEDFHVSVLPLVVEGDYKGLVKEDELFAMSASTVGEMFNNRPLFLEGKSVKPYQHLFDVFSFAEENNIDLIPITDENSSFEGVISLSDAVYEFSRKVNSVHPGGMVTLEIEAINYSLAEISRLAESNNTKITNVVVESVDHDPSRLRVNLRFNTSDISPTIATFQRFNYSVIDEYQLSENEAPSIDRLNHLLKYLEI